MFWPRAFVFISRPFAIWSLTRIMLGLVAAAFVLFSVGLLGSIPPEVDFRDKTSSSPLTMARFGANQPCARFPYLFIKCPESWRFSWELYGKCEPPSSPYEEAINMTSSHYWRSTVVLLNTAIRSPPFLQKPEL